MVHHVIEIFLFSALYQDLFKFEGFEEREREERKKGGPGGRSDPHHVYMDPWQND